MIYKDLDRARPPKSGLEARLAVKAGFSELHFDVPDGVAREILEASVASGRGEEAVLEWKGRRFKCRLVAARIEAFDPVTGKKESRRPGACTIGSLRSRP